MDQKISSVAKIAHVIAGGENLEACCLTCPFWNALPEFRAKNIGDVAGGECREGPPKGFVMPVETIAGPQMGIQSAWPRTASNQWCGAHPARELPDMDQGASQAVT